ncbi:VOC family protein [Mucilaginibacter flavidus]|uniref:VOC family protein n=1 Tax=Mucilaginibacter flavidus TaxID=2949309 RepID=UPI002092834A|nr:VOC family protein [Mucilaginibacter flavidus]MCO5948367.1 VOC family protein [Mucilaginibacter flavidus]
MNISLNRIILFGKDVEGLKDFYMQHFNFKLLEEISGEWVVLNAGAIEMAFHKIGSDFITESDEPFRVDSNSKLVFNVDSDLTAFCAGLMQQGVVLRDIKSFPGFNYLLCDGEDPEGNVFQLSQKLNNV